MTQIEITLLKGVTVRRNGIDVPLSQRQRELTFALLAGGQRPVSDRHLIEMLWNATVDRHTLHTAISKLRRKLGKDRIVRIDHPSGYRLDIRPGEPVDLWVWARLLHECASRYTSDPHTVVHLGTHALEMCDLDSLESLAGTPAMMSARHEIENDYVRTASQVAEIQLNLGNNAAVITALPRLVQRFPDHEHLRSLLMTALYRDQRPAQALALYDELAAARAGGPAPAPGLREIRDRILAQDPRLLEVEALPLPPADRAVDASGGGSDADFGRMTGAVIIQDPYSPDAYSRAVDRANVAMASAVVPDIVETERRSHEFAGHVVRLAHIKYRIGRFLELAPPLPLVVYKAARLMSPEARTVYAHHDDAFVQHLRATLAMADDVDIVRGTLKDPAALLEQPAVRDVLGLDRPAGERQPVAVLDRTEINITPGPGARDYYAALFAEAAPGSQLALVCASGDMSPLTRLQIEAAIEHVAQRDMLELRSLREITALVPPTLEILEPGVADLHQFCGSPAMRDGHDRWRHYGLIAVKPGAGDA